MGEKNLHYRIIECAYEMFALRGVKSVTMDEISSELSISKRTLYEEFSSKTELVKEIVMEMDSVYQKRNEEISKSTIDAIQKIFMIASINNDRNTKEELFFGDIVKNYPELIDKLIIAGYEYNIKKIMINIEQGVREGFFYEDIDAKIAIDLLFDLRFNLNFRKMKTKIDLRQAHIYSVVFFLRSIATVNGINRINDLCKINNINIYK